MTTRSLEILCWCYKSQTMTHIKYILFFYLDILYWFVEKKIFSTVSSENKVSPSNLVCFLVYSLFYSSLWLLAKQSAVSYQLTAYLRISVGYRLTHYQQFSIWNFDGAENGTATLINCQVELYTKALETSPGKIGFPPLLTRTWILNQLCHDWLVYPDGAIALPEARNFVQPFSKLYSSKWNMFF